MISTQTFENYPEFANAGQKSQPNDAKYAAGFIPSDVLPAEWLNWFLSGATKGVTALNTGVKSIEQEINAVLASRSVTPNINANNQLLTVLNKIKAEAVLAAHPVGSLYWTSKNENPAVTFGGGTWKQITDKFVLAAGSTYKAEATGGAATVKLTVANLPAHSHTFTPSGTVKSTFTGTSHSHTFTPSGTVESHSHDMEHDHSFSGTTTSALGQMLIPTGDRNNNNFKITDVYNKSHKNALHNYYTISIESFAPGSRMYAPSSSSDNTGFVYDLVHLHEYSGTTNKFKGFTKQEAPAFTGKAGTTGSTTQAGTVASTFTGTSSSTSSVGSATAINILPPYIVKYCWERTA